MVLGGVGAWERRKIWEADESVLDWMWTVGDSCLMLWAFAKSRRKPGIVGEASWRTSLSRQRSKNARTMMRILSKANLRNAAILCGIFMEARRVLVRTFGATAKNTEEITECSGWLFWMDCVGRREGIHRESSVEEAWKWLRTTRCAEDEINQCPI